jgi:hypothetical protein
MVDLGGSAVCLFYFYRTYSRRVGWNLYKQADKDFAIQSLSDLSLIPACPFFASTDNEADDPGMTVYIGQAADGVAALVTQRFAPDQPIRLRAAVSADGKAWQATPEFQPNSGVSILQCCMRRLPDAQAGVEHNWLELIMSGPVGDGDGLWLTRLPLP